MSRFFVALLLVWCSLASAAVSHVASNDTGSADQVSSLTLTVPAGTTTGDLILAVMSQDDAHTLTAPAGWTSAIVSDGSQKVSLRIWYRVATAIDIGGKTYTFTSTGMRDAFGGMSTFRGVDTSSPIVASAIQGHNNAALVVAPSISPAVTNTMLVAFWANNDKAMTVAPGMTATIGAPGSRKSGNVNLLVAHQSRAASGATGTRTAVASGGGPDFGALLALRPLAPLIDLQMDETSWPATTGAANDSGTNNLDGTPTVSNSALPSLGVGKLCNAGAFSTGYVNVPYNASLNPTNATFSFWIQPTGSGNFYPIVAKHSGSAYDYIAYIDNSGKLVFGWGSYGAGTSYQPTHKVTTAAAITLNAWTHVAIVFDDTNNTQAIYLNGSSSAAASGTATSSLGATSNPVQVGHMNASGWTPLQFNGRIDELKIFGSALSTGQIATVYTNENAGRSFDGATRACPVSGPDHYELALATSSLSCLPTTVTVTACATATAPCSSPYTAANGATATLATSGATLGATSVTFNASGVATTTLSHPSAANGTAATVTLSGESVAATGARQCCPGGASCSAASSCSTTFNSAGFIVSTTAGGAAATVPAQTAGAASGTYFLRAVRTNTTTKACESALSGTQTVNWALQCQNPTTCSAGNRMTLTGTAATAIASNPAAGISSTTGVAMTFDANGNAPFSFAYADVGQVLLSATRTVNSATLSGTTNGFVVRPASFSVTTIRQSASPNTVNPAAASATGGVFVKAGDGFSATVTALTSAGAAAPNFGKETAPEGVLLTPTLVLPAGGAAGTLANATIAGGSFTAGAATVTNLAYSEVGIVTLTPSVADGSYLGAGAVSGPTTGNVGRFVPARFAVSGASVTHRSTLACTPASTFSYLGENFRLGLTLTAQNTSGSTTINYTGAFAKLDPTNASAWQLAGRDGSSVFTVASGRLSLGTASGSFTNGVASGVTLSAAALRASAPDGPFNAAFGVAPMDSDGVALASFDIASASGGANDRASLGTLPLRFGRLRLGSAIGAADRALVLPAWAQHWNGSAWDTNTLDSCTTVAASAVSFGNLRRTLTTADTAASGPIAIAAGLGSLRLAAPGGGRSGSVDIALSLGSSATDASCLQPWAPGSGDAASSGANLAHLRGAWCGSPYANDPSARASFGLQRTQDHLIYRRENY